MCSLSLSNTRFSNNLKISEREVIRRISFTVGIVKGVLLNGIVLAVMSIFGMVPDYRIYYKMYQKYSTI